MITKKQLEKMLRRKKKQWQLIESRAPITEDWAIMNAGAVAGKIELLKKLLRSYSK